MYLPTIHAKHHIPTLRDLIRKNPLGILTTAIPSPSGSFHLLQSSHIPFILDVSDESSETELGILRGHMARENPQAKVMIETLTSQTHGADDGPGTLEQDVLIMFNARAHHYVTPKFYVKTKPLTGKVVPTWDYAAVEVYGRARVYYNARSGAVDTFLSKQVADLSRMGEQEIMGYENPWKVEDAPKEFVEMLKKGIVGLEIEVKSMAGKWKMSQEMEKGDRRGVIEGFEGLGNELGCEMARIVKERSDKMQEEGKV